jgi:hypothetical protein
VCNEFPAARWQPSWWTQAVTPASSASNSADAAQQDAIRRTILDQRARGE